MSKNHTLNHVHLPCLLIDLHRHVLTDNANHQVFCKQVGFNVGVTLLC